MKLPPRTPMIPSRKILYAASFACLVLPQVDSIAQTPEAKPTASEVKNGAMRSQETSTPVSPVVPEGQQNTSSATKASESKSIPSTSEVSATKQIDVPDDAIVLSPFEVTSERDRGYYGGKSMSGTRLGANVEDLPSSMTVITKQQLLDMSAVDINDIFASEVSTEGTRTYTETTPSGDILRGDDVDVVALQPTSANRIRGIGSANVSIGNFGTSSTIPIDTYNIDSVEISRGPNSTIFGIGGAAGTVNLVPSSANVSKDFSRVTAQYSSYGSTRATVDLNRVIWKNKVAFRVNGLINNQEYLRKPSYDDTRRLQIGTTIRPFKYTTLRASYEKFSEEYKRPNSNTPTDLIKLWNANGRHSWDPVTSTATWTDANGVTQTQVYGNLASFSNLGSFPMPTGTAPVGTGWISDLGSNRTRPSMLVRNGQSDWYGQTFWTDATAVRRQLAQLGVPANFNRPVEYQTWGGGNAALNYVPLVASSDKAFYDYENVNFAALNSGKKTAETVRAELEHIVFQTSLNTLGVQLGYFRENANDVSRNLVGGGTDGVPSSILPDINTRLSDGTPNPNYGKAYIGALAPQSNSAPVDATTWKGTLAYQIDFKELGGLWKHLGRHAVTGYGESYEKFSVSGGIRYRDNITQSYPWLPPSVIQNFATYNARYYFGDSTNSINSGTSQIKYGSNFAFRRFDDPSKTWIGESVPIGSVPFSLQRPTRIYTTTKGYVWQGFFLNDRIIPTIGRRLDERRSRTTGNGQVGHTLPQPTWSVDANGITTDLSWLEDIDENIEYDVVNQVTRSTTSSGYTDSMGAVVKVFPWIHLRYNESSSFNPADFAINYQGETLPNPQGDTKDYGVRLFLFDNKLSIDLAHYKTVSKDARAGNVATTGNRITNLDYDLNPAANGSAFDLEDWLIGEFMRRDHPLVVDAGGFPAPALLDAQQQAALLNNVYSRMQLSPELVALNRALARSTTSDRSSEGYEVEINFNPNRFLTMKLTGSQSESRIDSIAPTWQNYVDQRMPVWTTVTSPFSGNLWWTSVLNGGVTVANNYQTLNEQPMKVLLATQGLPIPEQSKYKASFLPRYRLAGLSSNKILSALTIGGKVSWTSKRSLGFYGKDPEWTGTYVPANAALGIPANTVKEMRVLSYDVNRPIWFKDAIYVDAFASYDFRILSGKVKSSLQLNIRNLTESGRLQPYSTRPDGTYTRYRIIDPREFSVTMSFDL